ncbi:MAG: class I SAM-dependent methyltransferase [Saprospiraceae bacterium]|nr:class I SAM-dependent methyltransferase [Lewinella sp.]
MDASRSAVSVFDASANEYQQIFMDQNRYRVALDLFCSTIQKKQANILELACGPGNITRYLLDKRPDFHLLATDLAPNMVDLARANNPEARCELMDCRSIGLLTEKYDGVVCGFGLPYLSKAEAMQLIEDAATRLSTGGVIYLSTMEDHYENSGLRYSSSPDRPPLFTYFHEAEYLVKALEQNHFEILHLRRQAYQTADKSSSIDLLIVAKFKNAP